MIKPNPLALLAMVSLLSGAPACDAATGYYMVTTYDVAGQASLDFKYWRARYGGELESAPTIGIGYGVTSRWYTEVYGTWEKEGSDAMRFEALSWQNDLMLTQGQYDVDVALHTRISRPRERDEGYAVEWGPVMQTEFGRTQLNANLFFQRDYRAQGPAGASHHTELSYQLQLKHRWTPHFQPGVQAFGEVGKWNHWESAGKQSHRVGPAFFGSHTVGKHEIKYEAAYLVGRTEGQSSSTFSMRVQAMF